MTSASNSHQRIFILMCCLIALNHLTLGSVQPALALHARNLGAMQWVIGFAFGIVGLGRFIATLPAGALADQVGRRYALAMAGLVLALGNWVCYQSTEYVLLIVGRLISGIGTGMVITVGQVVVMDVTTPLNRGRILAIYRAVSTFALGFGPYPGGVLATYFGFDIPFLANVVAGVLIGLGAWFFMPTQHDRQQRNEISDSGFFVRLLVILKLPGFVLATLVGFTIGAAREGIFKTLAPLIGHDRLLLTPDQIGLSIAIASLFGLLAAYPSGYLVDKYGHKVAIVPALLLAAVSLYLFLTVTSKTGFTAACIAWCLATGISGLVPIAYAVQLMPRGMNAGGVSAYHFLADIGAFFGPALVGIVADVTETSVAIQIMIVWLILLGVAFARFAPTPCAVNITK